MHRVFGQSYISRQSSDSQETDWGDALRSPDDDIGAQACDHRHENLFWAPLDPSACRVRYTARRQRPPASPSQIASRSPWGRAIAKRRPPALMKYPFFYPCFPSQSRAACHPGPSSSHHWQLPPTGHVRSAQDRQPPGNTFVAQFSGFGPKGFSE